MRQRGTEARRKTGSTDYTDYTDFKLRWERVLGGFQARMVEEAQDMAAIMLHANPAQQQLIVGVAQGPVAQVMSQGQVQSVGLLLEAGGGELPLEI